MNFLTITNNDFSNVRIINKEGEPWFVGKDICSYFGDMNHNRTLSRVYIVLNKYNPISEYWAEGSSLCLSDILFIFKLVYCAPLHPFFVFKAMMNIARYSDMIKRHKPKTMIQFGEFSFSSSILTAYCHKKGVRHIDVMHGEKVYCIKDAFFHYDECYVWDDYYVTLFISLRAEASQFRIALPPSIKIECEKYLRSDAYADYKYYLGLYSEDEIKSIVFSMQFAKREGKTVKYRIHPRYSDVNLLKKYVQESEIEYPKDVTILESISNLEYAVGLFTTVLTQAYYSGKKVIMDDMTYKELYAKMGSISYILTSKVKDKLSDMQ